MTPIQQLVSDFTRDLTTVMHEYSNQRLRDVLAIGTVKVEKPRAIPGRTKDGRRKGPIQFCPVPSCANRAAPVFGMLCARHKDIPKAKVKKYREARRLKKARS